MSPVVNQMLASFLARQTRQEQLFRITIGEKEFLVSLSEIAAPTDPQNVEYEAATLGNV